MTAMAAWLAEQFLGERERWVLWLPVALALGVALYFSLPAEPPPWLALLWLGLALSLVLAGRRRPGMLLLGIAATALAAGFAAAVLRTHQVAAPVIERRLGPVDLSGRVVEVEPRSGSRGGGRRLTIAEPEIGRLASARTPARVRVVVRGKGGGEAQPGDWIRTRAILLPPPPPAAPGAFDFARQAYFRGLGGVGFTVRGVEVVAPPEDRGQGFLTRVAALRHAVVERVRRVLAGRSGAVAAALMTGHRGAIGETELEAMRDAGLAHLLAISGLHVGLIAAVIFFVMRALLATSPWLALRQPIKKWSAMVTICGAFAYLLMAGATIPTQRAFLMTSLVLIAVLFDRLAFSMGLVAWAAAMILLISPEALLGASFQMSFAAVVALIAAYEVGRQGLVEWRGRQGGWGRGWRWPLIYLAGIALTTLVAGLATAPFALVSFNRVVSYGLVANLLAVPLMALWIMPLVVAAYALMPLGLEALALWPMGLGIEAVLRVAETVAAWPGAVSLWPALPPVSLALIAGGGVWLCLWRRGWRFFGLVPLAAGLALVFVVRPADVLVDGRGQLMAVQDPAGRLRMSRQNPGFGGRIWLRRAGTVAGPAWPRQGAGADGRLSCDRLGCLYRARGQVVALVRDARALAEDCRRVTVVVSAVPVRRCPSAVTLIDRFDLWRRGAHALWLEPGGVRVENVNEIRGRRPWVARRRNTKGGS